MVILEQLSKDLQMNPEKLIRECIETFLRRKLKIIESELFLLAKKYGVTDVFEFDKMVREGKGDSMKKMFSMITLNLTTLKQREI